MRLFKKLVGWMLGLAIVALPFVIYVDRNAIIDWWKLRGYTPPAAVATLANQDTMTHLATHLLYINHPRIITGVKVFRQDCPDSEQTIVLGCYHPPQEGIYIYNVQDSQLYGVQQVTAAHEMLHAAYARLSSGEKTYVDGLLWNYYKNNLTDPRVLAEVKLYQQTEPGYVLDEMHSTFGTEIANLPAPLAAYYTRYFTNRAAVTTYASDYQGAFTERQDQVNADDTQLASMKATINAEENSLTVQSAQIDSDRAKLESEKNSGDITDYNAGVDGFNAEVAAYNSGVDELQAHIAAYNNLVATRNSIAAALASLDAAIDTRLTTQASQ